MSDTGSASLDTAKVQGVNPVHDVEMASVDNVETAMADKEALVPGIPSGTVIREGGIENSKWHPAVQAGLTQREERKQLEAEQDIRTVQIVKVEGSLLDIDDASNEYRILIDLQMNWYDPKYMGHTRGEIEEPAWIPDLHFKNASSRNDAVHVRADDYSVNNSDSGLILCSRSVIVTHTADMDLLTFPFDRQTFSFSIRGRGMVSPLTGTEVLLTARKISRLKFLCDGKTFVYRSKVSEWVPASNAVGGSIVHNATGTMAVFNNDLRCVIAFERQPWYYIWNIVLVLFLITCMASYTFSISEEDSSSRLELNFTLVLTTVAFKYTVSSYLPRITYLTLMDKYVLACFIFLGFIGFENAVVAALEDADLKKVVDNWFLYVAGGLWLALHVAGIIGIWRKSFYPAWSEEVSLVVKEVGKTVRTR